MPVLVAVAVATVVSAVLLGVGTLHHRRGTPGDVHGDPVRAGAAIAPHSWLRKFLLERRDPQRETGLLLTVAIALVALAILAIGALLELAQRNDAIARWDSAAARYGAENASSSATDWMRRLTELGASRVALGVAVVVGAIGYWRSRRPAMPAYTLVTVLLTLGVNNLVKAIVDRPRPDVAQLVGHSGSSFPSGHTAAAAATYAAVALVLGQGLRRRVQALLVAGAAAITVAVAASRVLLGVHWLTDVAAGAAMGWACFAVTSIAFGGRELHFGRPVELAQATARRVEPAMAAAEANAAADDRRRDR